MSKTERLGIRTDPEFKNKLEKMARADNRSLSNYIEKRLQEMVDLYIEEEAAEFILTASDKDRKHSPAKEKQGRA